MSSHVGDFQQSIELLSTDNKPKGILPSRLKLDEEKVKSNYDLLMSWGNLFKSNESVSTLCGGSQVGD